MGKLVGECSWRGDPLEGLKRVLGFQVRSPGAPGPLTLKEVEELEQLTQQLMQDMEHPQRQNVAVSGEPIAPFLGCLSSPTPFITVLAIPVASLPLRRIS